MKTVIKESFKALLAFSVLLSLTICLAAFANASEHKEGGHGGGNGGDPDERRFREISQDISNWIQDGGPAQLVLPPGLDLQTYSQEMSKFLDPQITTVEFTVDKVFVGAVEKTCKNYFDSENGNRASVLCNTARFRATPEAEQYTLVHHEYAGLAGFETNFGASSNYTISNQLTEYLEPTAKLRLGIKKQRFPCNPLRPLLQLAVSGLTLKYTGTENYLIGTGQNLRTCKSISSKYTSDFRGVLDCTEVQAVDPVQLGDNSGLGWPTLRPGDELKVQGISWNEGRIFFYIQNDKPTAPIRVEYVIFQPASTRFGKIQTHGFGPVSSRKIEKLGLTSTGMPVVNDLNALGFTAMCGK